MELLLKKRHLIWRQTCLATQKIFPGLLVARLDEVMESAIGKLVAPPALKRAGL
jgi:hypothetical protein